ncbi:hypothetical protein [Streptomyces sp. bgisy032]|uniref:hypothetical protein n=1 Tax=Streptomyces sp. bgisy032 TaxID=3413773 RepID=UPI003D72FA48
MRDVTKWRIRRKDGQWCVYSPGWLFTPIFVGNSFRHCVNALPYIQRIDSNSRRLRRGR